MHGARPHGTQLHAEGSAAWDASAAVLDWLGRELTPGMRTLETGAGQSTLLFAERGCRHDVVTPSPTEAAAIRAEADRRGIDMGEVTFHQGFSQDVLPRLVGDGSLDVVFIDGGHGFPIPALDFQYTAPRLKVGGALLIDDVDLWTGDMIVQVLRRDRAWRYDGKLNGRTAVFRTVAPFAAHEWTQQPYVVGRSFWPQTRRKLVNGARLLLTGRFAAAAGKLRNERKLLEAARYDR